MAFNDPIVYAKYLAADGGCGCGGSSSSHDSHDPCKDCGCCPPGLIELKDADGKVLGCVTPADAQEYMATTYACPPGYMRYNDPTTGDFVGCILPADYLILKPVTP